VTHEQGPEKGNGTPLHTIGQAGTLDRDAGVEGDLSAGVELTKVPWRAVALFVVVACALAWAVAAPLWVIGAESDMFPILLPVIGVIMMYTPALATLAALFIAKTPRGERLRFLGMWPLRPSKRVVWMTVGAIFAPVVIVILSIAIAVAFDWVELDLVHFSGFAETLAASVPASAAAAMPPVWLLVALQFAMIPLGAVINSVAAFGEEVGWRGWLLPALKPLGIWPALILSGAIWGLWHSPLILLGYNFGLTDWRGVALMTVACVFWGILLGWSRIRSGSVWPAVVGHGALNASAGLVLVVAAADQEPSLALVLPLGVAGWIASAIAVVILVLLGQFSPARRPQLAERRTRPVQAPATLIPGAAGEAAPDQNRSDLGGGGGASR